VKARGGTNVLISDDEPPLVIIRSIPGSQEVQEVQFPPPLHIGMELLTLQR
jgi:hypothetical protein